MTMPSIYCFELSNEDLVRVVVCVSMSEEDAIESVKFCYPKLDIDLVDIISIQETGKVSEICAFDR